MSVRTKQVTMYEGICDYPGCDAMVAENEYGSTEFWSIEDLQDEADEDDWMVYADNVDDCLYCPKHWHRDGDGNAVSNDGKAHQL